jgi:hypothetical protein
MIAVQAHPSATAEQLAALNAAIVTWSNTLQECFDGLITLRKVTGAKRQAADIVVHYVPTAGSPVRLLAELASPTGIPRTPRRCQAGRSAPALARRLQSPA